MMKLYLRSTRKALFLITTFSLFTFCKQNAPNNSKDTIKQFRQVPSSLSNVLFSNHLKENDSLNYLTYGYIYMGGGVATGDINNDGLIDLYFTGNQVPNKLYLNKGNLKFEDITENAGVNGDSRWYTGVTMIDINHDGYLDFYCSVGGKFAPKNNQLFVNNGDNTFTERAKEFGLDDPGNSVQATFLDYDKDGDLDMYLANYPPTPFNAPNHYYKSKMRLVNELESDKLFRNDGTRFTNVTEEAGLKSFGLSLSATVGDVNQDGWPDIYVSNDFASPDYFYINNTNGTFSEKIKSNTKNTSFYGMGVDIADFNNDALLDILQVDMTAQDNRRSKANMASMNADLFWSTVESGFHYQYMQNSLQLNNGNVNDSLTDFSNISRLAGISSTDWSWSPLMIDFDNDGWKDIFISNGTRREINNKDYFANLDRSKLTEEDLLEKSLAIPSEKIDNYIFKNNRDLTFSKVNEEWGFSYKGFSNGATYADLDNDGDLEIIINNIDDKATIFENTNNSKNNYVTIQLHGPKKNPDGVGSKVWVYADGNKQFQELTLTRGFQSSVAPLLHFGIEKSTNIDSLVVLWTSEKINKLYNIASNQKIEINFDTASSKNMVQDTIKSKEYFTNIGVEKILSEPFLHTENYFDDFRTEVLLPHQTSRLGPGVAVGDLNGDSLEDFVIGGAHQNKMGVYFQNNKKLVRQEISVFKNDSMYEDMGIHIFDADNDGLNDIYIVSGGNEFVGSKELVKDRLYLNIGNGDFVKTTKSLPNIFSSGSRVHSCDYDKDGDLDLFVGGRLAPGNYGQPVSSYIFENKSKKGAPEFEDNTAVVAPDLIDLGMVTDGIFTDFDQDGWMDLIVVGEWLPITVLRNNNGTFENVTKDLGLSDTAGWWFSIKEGDFDDDGDMDYIAGNLGLNFKYQANEKETFDLYVNDFDQNGSQDIVLSYFNGGKKYPLRGRECSSQQMPGIKKKFENYASFSLATLEDVYSEEALSKALHYKVKSFASVYIENKNGNFKMRPLPNLAQMSSIHQIEIDDFDNDGHLDAIVGGNLYRSEVETPRNDASNGLFLKGDGTGFLQPISTRDSKLFISGDVKDFRQINIQGKPYFLVAKNNEKLQIVKLNN